MDSRRRPYKKNQKYREEDYFNSFLNQDAEHKQSEESNPNYYNNQNYHDNHNDYTNYSSKAKNSQQTENNYHDQHKNLSQTNQNFGHGINFINKKYLEESDYYYNTESNTNYWDNHNQNHYQNYNYNINYQYQNGNYSKNYYNPSNKFSYYNTNYTHGLHQHGNYNFNSDQYAYQDKDKPKHKNKNQNHHHDSTYKHTHNPDKRKKHKHDKHEPTLIQKKQKINSHLLNLQVEIPELTLNHIIGLIEASIDCMICGEAISSTTEIWECNTCYTLYHNKCIYDWIFKLNSSKTETKEVFIWTCPHCNHNYQETSDNLPVYNCYCERFYTAQDSGDKEFDPDLIPHGCGLKCDKVICQHVKCTLPCHPGPHITCNIVEKIKCFCTRNEKEVLCTNPNKKFSCNQKCNNLLKCNRHKCQITCHEGDCEQYLKNKKCEECVEESKRKFLRFLKDLESKINNECKLNLNSLADCLSEFIFNGTLLCSHHQEEANTENNLQFLLKLIKISGNKLIENIKKFIPICKKIVDNSCDCKNKTTKVECYKLNYPKDILVFLEQSDEKEIEKCTKVCKTFKSCKIHRCNKVCCELANKIIRNYSVEDPLGYHLCLIPCEKLLSCKKHKCENYCHKGNCKPCATIIREGSISCDCGKTKIQAPFQCGITVDCKFPCDKPRKCEHKCKLTCHSGECPPCDEITFKVCNCNKNVIQNLKCGDVKIPACFTPCQEMLPCGVHFCQIKCHDHSEDYDINYFCTIPCGRDFSKCKHKCTKRCHGEDECNEVECETVIKIFCACKVNWKNIKCGEYKKLIEKESTYVLPCSEECKKKDRLKKIEQAFDGLLKFSDEKYKAMYKKTDTPQTEDNTTLIKYSDVKFDSHIIEFVKNKIKFFIELEQTIDKAVINLEKKYEIHNLDKKLYMFTSELLKNCYNIKTQKVKNINDAICSLVLSDCSEATLPKLKLSLLALLFKHRKFVEDTKVNLHHPFEMSIFIQNYRYSVTIENLENHLLYLTKNISKNDFYIDEITKGKCYIHFFNLELGQKIFNSLKNTPSQFQDCYEHVYERKETKYEDLYLYIKNTDYYNKLYFNDENLKENSPSESGSTANPKSSEDEMDTDGFVKVKKNKKPK